MLKILCVLQSSLECGLRVIEWLGNAFMLCLLCVGVLFWFANTTHSSCLLSVYGVLYGRFCAVAHTYTFCLEAKAKLRITEKRYETKQDLLESFLTNIIYFFSHFPSAEITWYWFLSDHIPIIIRTIKSRYLHLVTSHDFWMKKRTEQKKKRS